MTPAARFDASCRPLRGDPRNLGLGTLRLRLLRLAPRPRRLLLASAGAFVASRAVLRDDYRRVAAARVLAAGVPESSATIVGLFDGPTTLARASARFSVCVALGMCVAGTRTSGTYGPLLMPLMFFLHFGRKDVELDMWSVGCLLGTEWPLQESLPVLAELAMNARYAAGRGEGAHGLVHLMSRMRGRRKAKVRSALRWLARHGRGRGVREMAQLGLDGKIV